MIIILLLDFLSIFNIVLKYPDIVPPIPVAARSKLWVYVSSLAGLWVRIPPWEWIRVCCGCCMLSGRGLCVGPITRPEESYSVIVKTLWGIPDPQSPLSLRKKESSHVALYWTTPFHKISRQDAQIIAAFTPLPFLKSRWVPTSWLAFWR